MSSYHFTPDDQMQPVYCVGCRQHIPRTVSAAGRGLCPLCLAKVQVVATPPSVAPPPVAGIPQPAPQKASNPVLLWSIASVILVSGATYAAITKVRSDRRMAGLQAVLSRLQQRYPDRRFAIGIGDGTIPFRAKLSDLQVDEVEVTQRDGSVRAKVRFSSIHFDRKVKPKVIVSAFDEKGRELGRSAVVEHLFEDLEPGETETTTDEFRIEGKGTPVIFAVDDDLEWRRIEAYLAEQGRVRGEQRIAVQQREEAVRGPKPDTSRQDKMTPEANAWLKRNLRDYDSIKLEKCSMVLPWGSNAWIQHIYYRVPNGSGDMDVVSQAFVIRNRKVIDVMGAEQ